MQAATQIHGEFISPAGATAAETAPASNRMLWSGRIMSAFVVLFLLFDSIIKVLELVPAGEGTAQLGFPEKLVFDIGVIQLLCLALYLIPRTSVLGAILLTGYLGGAIAIHMRVENPLFTHTLFPVYIAVLIWGGLFLRDARLRALIPLRK